MIKLYDKDTLIRRVSYTQRPIAFLVGAPLSSDEKGGVPGVKEMLQLVRKQIEDTAPSALAAYDKEMSGKSSSDAYQAAMEWLQANINQDAVNDVIVTAVNKAKLAGNWYIPDGTRQLAQVICAELNVSQVQKRMNRFPGPILTTNFDPLLTVALKSCGVEASYRVVQSDGVLADIRKEGIEVIHLHGFWSGSDTLHTPAQLTSPRPQLRDSLRRILRKRTLLVVAYGGWDDVFARALAEVALDDDAQLDVLWCFRDTDPGSVAFKYKDLLARVTPAITRGRFLCYGGILCHSIFGEIAGSAGGGTSSATAAATPPAATAPAAPPPTAKPSPIPEWEWIDGNYLDQLPKLRSEEVIRYFDGVSPTWRHACHGDIPQRAPVAEIAKRLEEAGASRSECSLQLIRAAGGEGKSTILLQTGAWAVRSGNWNVLWRPTPRVGLPAKHLCELDAGQNWLFVADDAESLIRDIEDAARHLHEQGRSNVHFLLASRDTDWYTAGGDRVPWNSWLTVHPEVRLRALADDDARQVVDAWQKYGPLGLRDLVNTPDRDQQVARLLKAVRGDGKHGGAGSFFGGLLAVRFSPVELKSHILSLLTRLKTFPLENSGFTFFDALLYIAACHLETLPGIEVNVLADLLKTDRDWVHSRVIRPLQEEAPIVSSAGHALTRHDKVAAAILVTAHEKFGIKIAEIWTALVRQTVKTHRSMGAQRSHELDRFFKRIVHIAPLLVKLLPTELGDERAEIAIAAAKADIAAEPDRLCALTDLGRVYRETGKYSEAVKLFRDHVGGLKDKTDYRTDVRGYWHEWALAESWLKPPVVGADAWLQSLSLSDHLPAPVTNDNTMFVCAGLGLAFGKLGKGQTDCPFELGRQAATYLGRLTRLNDKTRELFDKREAEAAQFSIPSPKDLDEAIGWLTKAVVKVGGELSEDRLKSLVKPEKVTFHELRKFLAAAAKQLPPPSGPQLAASNHGANAHPQPTLLPYKQRIQQAIELIKQESWRAAGNTGSQERRLKQAKQEALRLISQEPADIRGHVSQFFTSQKWQPLIESQPKS